MSAALFAAAAGCTQPSADSTATTVATSPSTSTAGPGAAPAPTAVEPAPSDAPEAPATTDFAPTTTGPAPTTVPPAPPAPSPPTTGAPAPPSPPSSPADFLLRRGSQGEPVRALQQRLLELRFWLPAADGTYGPGTEQAVGAFQKANGLAVDGVAGPATQAALGTPRPIAPRRGQGRVIEVDLSRQLLIFADGGTVTWVLNTSTGTDRPYQHPTQGPQLADTPEGRWSISWEIDGVEHGDLGELYRPKYFHTDGIAFHGYPSVPFVPASHGCVRVSNAAMDMIWASGLAPRGAAVWVYR